MKELYKSIINVMIEARKPLHPNQQKIDVHEPEKDEITGKDFEMLRAGKKAKAMKEEEELDELSKDIENINLEDDADETILVHSPIEVDIKESYVFGEYLNAAKVIVGEEAAVELANYAFNKQDTDIFVEQFLRSDIEAKVKAHEKAGHKVSTPKYSTKSGHPYAEYVVTDKEGMRRKYIHHGSNRKTQNMGTVGKETTNKEN